MKAIVCERYGPPEVLKIAEVPKPVPKENEILVKVRATTVAVADSRIRAFRVPPAFWLPGRLSLGITKPRKPILGVELSGEVESTGRNVKRFRQGDEVFAATLFNFGGYAEYICLPENSAVAMKPRNTSFEEAAAIPIGARTAFYYLKAANVDKGKKILIYGASGSVGTYMIQLAKHYGAEVTAVCSAANVQLVQSLGASKVLDYTSPDFVSRLEKYDVVIDAVDKLEFSVGINAVKDGGVYANITSPVKSIAMMLSKKKVLVGVDIPETSEGINQLKDLVESGVLKPVMDKIYPFEQIVEAHRYVDTGRKKGNVAITV
ncbi:MAG TPA: NAD(P)-dependent alcohol dehydrogenase [Cyclobacteriaceae bacterium]|nr:NAD(P)-dependent alcohol dehydrogenase [Cyclobacteriaceae bacterium]